MKFITPILLTLLTVACGACRRAGPSDTVESLLANPERLKTMREQWRINHEELGDALCRRVAVATSQQFLGIGAH